MCGVVCDIVEGKYLLTPVTLVGSGGVLSCIALIDTGSSDTLIQDNIAKQLKFISGGDFRKPVRVANGNIELLPTYKGDIYFNEEFGFKGVIVVGGNMPPVGKHLYDVLIGMDIISKCNLIIDSTAQKFMICKTGDKIL